MKKLKDLVQTTKYTDKKTGEERKKYTTHGALLERDDGSMVVVLHDVLWLNAYDPKPRRQSQHNVDKSNGYQQEHNLTDEIPF